MKKLLWLGVLLVVAMGCSTSDPADPDLEAWTREVRVIEPHQVGDRDYEEVASFEERVSIGTFGEQNAIATAKENLRRRAATVDADALVLIDCGRHVQSVEPNRTPSLGPEVICQGVAIRWKSN